MIYTVVVCYYAIGERVADRVAYSGASYEEAREAMNMVISVFEEDTRVENIEYDSPSLHVARARAVTASGPIGVVYMTM